MESNKLIWICDDSCVVVNYPGLQPGLLYENGQSYNDQFTTVYTMAPSGPITITSDSLGATSAQLGFGVFTIMDFAQFIRSNSGIY